eukprot:XP_001704935.1 Hypothetical protein GL50803_3067 [Giardia lamblia ATCC 50803]
MSMGGAAGFLGIDDLIIPERDILAEGLLDPELALVPV